MCKKPFDSLICTFTFFLVAFSGLIATSGVALRLGGILMNKQEPENTEYPFYAAESGFFIGVKSAAFFQWMTAGFVTLFAKVNAADSGLKLCDRIINTYIQNFLLVGMFGAFHYFSLPMSVQDEAKCADLTEQLVELKGSRMQNPLCEGDRSWVSLFTAFAMGASICFVGCLLLQTMYLCLRQACDTETTPNTEPTAEVPVVVVEPSASTDTVVEMASIPGARF